MKYTLYVQTCNSNITGNRTTAIVNLKRPLTLEAFDNITSNSRLFTL